MEVVDTIALPNGRRIDLCRGDLAALPRREWFDAVLISTMPGDYSPTQTSVVGALGEKGVSVEKLSADARIDHRSTLGVWVSQPIETDEVGIGLGRIICFEPDRLGSPPEVVGRLFRSMPAVLDEAHEVKSIAMPILSTGDRGIDVRTMLVPLLEAAMAALGHGLPLDRIAIVSRDPSEEVRAIFRNAKDSVAQYDVFVSYSRRDADLQRQVQAALEETRPGTRVFVDQAELDVGAAWQQEIFESMDRCRLVVALLSPAYLESKACLEEFNIAWMRGRDASHRVLMPLYVEDAALYTYIRSVQFADCRARDEAKIRVAVSQIARQLPD